MIRGTLIAVIAGAGIAMQVRLLGRLAVDSGPQVVALLVSVAGLATALAFVALTRDWASLGRTVTRPQWVTAGALGVVAVAGLGVAASQASTVATLAGSITGQLVVGTLLDRI